MSGNEDLKATLRKLRRAIKPGLRTYLPWASTKKVMKTYIECEVALASALSRLEEAERREDCLHALLTIARRACAGALWLMGNDLDRSCLNARGWIQPVSHLALERLRDVCYSVDGLAALARSPEEAHDEVE